MHIVEVICRCLLYDSVSPGALLGPCDIIVVMEMVVVWKVKQHRKQMVIV